MTCPRCHAENRDGLRFCEDCGSRLTLTCGQCGGDLAPGKRFCGSCGAPAGESAVRTPSPESYTPKHLAERILTSKAALEGERKQVTVLFADLKGSMELLADRDAEEARKLLDPVLERMMEAVHHYEGTVNQVMGDGIMALFGAPLAHEDHAVRACYAALRMQRRVNLYADEIQQKGGTPVQIRVGVHSGEVVVRAIGSDLHMDYSAVGQTTHLAARMEQMAKPGSALVTGATLKLAEGYVQVRPLGPVPVKGLEAPTPVYELTGTVPARSRLQASATRGLTRFVGRGSELQQLGHALDRAAAGHGQAVAVVGEPGVGKSRLAWEFTRSHRTDGWLVLDSGSVSYGTATPYLPVIELLKAYCRIQERDEPQEIRERVAGKLLMLDRALEPLLTPMLALLDVPVDDATWATLDPPQRRKRILDGIKRLLLRESQVRPLLLLFEDLHWIDAETQALLDGLMESLPSARILLLVSYRPEYQHGWGGKTCYLQLRIDPLPPESAEELLRALLGEDRTLDPLKQMLIGRTEGNPFFLEESVQALVETKAIIGERGAYRMAKAPEKWETPATVQAILAARIDRLAPEEKRLLQAASVIGKDLPFTLLQAIAGVPEDSLRRGLTQLQAAEFLYETSLFPDLEYTFKHALTREVAYSGVLQERRRELHARIVDAIETVHQDRLNEHIERLAHHGLRGKLGEKAVHYLRQAGDRAAARSALPDAQSWFEQALGVLAGLPENPATLEQAFEILLELRAVLAQLGEIRPALERLREAAALAERLNDDLRRGQVCAFMTPAHNNLGELDAALVSGARALEIADRCGDLRLRIVTTTYLEQAHFFRGDYDRAIELATENLAALPADWIYESFGNVAPASIYDRCWLVHSLAHLGRFSEAAAYEGDAIHLAEATQHANSVGIAHYAAGVLYLLKGEWTKAHLRLDRGLAVFRAGHVSGFLRNAVAASACALAQLGHASEARSRLQEGELLSELLTAGGVVGFSGWSYQLLGRVSLLLGGLDEAQCLGERAIVSAPGYAGFAAHARHLLGDIATHPDRFNAESGEAHYRQALALATDLGMRPLIAHCHLGLGTLYRRTGDHAKAEEHLTTARAMYREMDMGFYLAQTDAAGAEGDP